MSVGSLVTAPLVGQHPSLDPFSSTARATASHTTVDPHTGIAEPRDAGTPERLEIASWLDTVAPLSAPSPQDTDYSVTGLFMTEHGEFYRSYRRFRPKLRTTFLYQPDSKIKGERGSFDLAQLRFDLDVDLFVDPDTFLIVGATALRRDYELSDTFSGGSGDEELNQVSGRFGLGHFFSEDLLIEGFFEPGLWSDFDGGPNSSDWQFFGEAIATWRMQSDVYLRGGIAVTEEIADLDVLPLLGITWLPAEEWRLDVLLPRYILATWYATAEMHLNAGLSLEGAEWHYRSPSSFGKNEFDIQSQEIRVFAGAEYRFSDQLSTHGRFGSVIGGDYKYRGEIGDANGTLEASVFFEVGLGVDW